MKVLYVIPGTDAGASMIFARRQAEALTRAGVTVHSVHVPTPKSLRGVWRSTRTLRHEIRTVSPDLVHAQYGSLIGTISAFAAGSIPSVVTFRGSDLNGGAARWALSQAAALRSRRAVCVSGRLARRLLSRRRTLVLPSGVDRATFQPEPRDTVRKRLGWSIDDPIVVFNAGFDPSNKRLDLAERAAEAARASLPNLRLLVLRGETQPSSVPDLLNASDCLLIASDREGSPCILQEALACGLPVVSVDVGDCAERLAGVPNTILSERDPESLGRAIVELVREPKRSAADTSELGFDRLAERLKRLYEEICERNTSRC